MPFIRRFSVSWALVCLAIIPVSAGTAARAGSDSDDATTTGPAAEIIRRLESAEFSERVDGQQAMVTLADEHLPVMARYAVEQASAEAAVRILNALEQLLVTSRGPRLATVCEQLEKLAIGNRLIVRREAQWLLSVHWRPRQTHTLQALEEHGALIVRPETTARMAMQFPDAFDMGAPTLQIFLTAQWKGGSRGRELLDRLPGLHPQAVNGQAARNLRFRGRFPGRLTGTPPMAVVFLVKGHRLTKEETGQLRGAYGAQVQERGEVMLGIRSRAAVVSSGCGVHGVTPFGSGAAAGLRPGDLITHVEDTRIRSFDDLVEALRRYSPGDRVALKVVRSPAGRRLSESAVEVLDVTLKSWADYVRAINAADAETPSSDSRI